MALFSLHNIVKGLARCTAGFAIRVPLGSNYFKVTWHRYSPAGGQVECGTTVLKGYTDSNAVYSKGGLQPPVSYLKN